MQLCIIRLTFGLECADSIVEEFSSGSAEWRDVVFGPESEMSCRFIGVGWVGLLDEIEVRLFKKRRWRNLEIVSLLRADTLLASLGAPSALKYFAMVPSLKL